MKIIETRPREIGFVYEVIVRTFWMTLVFVVFFVIFRFRFEGKIWVLGPVFQSIVSLTMSLGGQLVKYMLATYSNTSLFFVGKV